MNIKLAKIISSLVLFAAAIILTGKAAVALIIAAYVISGYETVIEAVENIFHGQVFDENFLMTVASLGAMFLGEYEEAAAVMIFYQIGEYFEDYAVDKSRKSIADLMDIRPEKAVALKDGKEMVLNPDEVEKGDILIIRPGEKIPVDSIVIEGNSSVNTSALTGESVPEEIEKGSNVFSGSINMTGLIKVKAEKRYEDSTVAKILEMVEEASSRKAPVENFITKFAKVYTPIVVISAVLLALIPPLVTNMDFSTWIYRACLFLVVSCPCALVISVPMSFFSGIGAASSRGILVKGGNYLQNFANLDTVMLDKTGTLTKGKFEIAETDSKKEDLLKIAASLEQYSNHPIAKCIAAGYEGEKYEIAGLKEIAGKGVSAEISGEKYYAGNARLMDELGIKKEASSTVVYIAKEDEYIGYIKVKDTLKEEAADAVKNMKIYVSRIVMLTGDNDKEAESIAKEAGISEFYAKLLPQDKVNIAERIISESDGRCAFAGDGINDAPVLARADVGIAMGGLGTAAAMEAADVIIMDDNLEKIPLGIKIGKKTLRLCRENIWFAIGVKVTVLILGALGLCNMWAAVFADVGVAVICILNSMRALKVK